MGFGQYVHQRWPGQEDKRDSGFPVPRHRVKVGRMTVAEIMAGVPEPEDQIKRVKKTGHNQVLRVLTDGTVIIRLRETDIVTIYPSGTVVIDTGGWNTITTRQHIMGILFDWLPGVYWMMTGAKPKAANALNGHLFNRRLVMHPDGTVTTDI